MKRSKSAQGHYAKRTAKELADRHKQTNEVKGVLTGEGFKAVKPRYESKPDLRGAEIHY